MPRATNNPNPERISTPQAWGSAGRSQRVFNCSDYFVVGRQQQRRKEREEMSEKKICRDWGVCLFERF